MMKYFFLIMAFLLIGCTSFQLTSYFTYSKVNDEKALVYLYRPSSNYHAVNPDVPAFYFNDEKVVSLKIGGYIEREMDPGPLVIKYSNPFLGITMWKEAREVKINLVAGKTYFIKYSLAWDQLYFDQVEYSQGLREIRLTRLLSR